MFVNSVYQFQTIIATVPKRKNRKKSRKNQNSLIDGTVYIFGEPKKRRKGALFHETI
jgi:hypothetical protein